MKQHDYQPENERFLSRRELSTRWGVCCETLKRQEAKGILKAHRLDQRLLRYSLKSIKKIESEALAK